MRFIALFGFLVIGIGIFLQSKTDIPYLTWLGHLPGDLLIKKDGVLLYFPLTSSFMFSLLFSLFTRVLQKT